ncbi:MAG: hypothetical protein JNM93_03020 [Bacteriovoracaceae bacterium]|nr:hypothetical protein [Bacteriovoracaceae bacterium]
MKASAPASLAQANQIIEQNKNFLKSGQVPLKSQPDYLLDISDASKALAKPTLDLKPTDVKEIKAPEIKIEAPSVDIPSPSSPVINSSEVKESVEKAKQIKDAAKADEKKIAEVKEKSLKGTVDKPAIFFVGGLELFSSDILSGSYKGIKDMSEYVNGARYYGWDQKSEMIEEIQKRKSDAPVIIVGHSLGGDTAVEIAQELNTLENGFRKVDLLFTIDSVGLNNDIIPSNVKKNIHYFGNQSWFLNDGPNWAENQKKTEVENNLLPVDHTKLDDNIDVQAHVLAEIDTIV